MNYVRGLALLWSFWLMTIGQAEEAPTLHFRPAEGTVLARGITAARESRPLARLLKIYVLNDDGEISEDTPQIIGDYKSMEGTIRFTPRFGFDPGIRYRANLEVEGFSISPLDFGIAKQRYEPSTTVTAIYPGGDVLPENQLRFYLHFSAPMSRGFAARHVKLFADNGKVVDLPFLELDQELWDPDFQRLTLFFDPGRVKRGLKPHEESGPVLIAGERYTLVVEDTFEDSKGMPLATSFRKTFQAGAVDYTQPDESLWKVTAPPTGTKTPLRVTFEAPLDHGMLQRMIEVIDSSGNRIDGTIAVGQQEAEWTITPTEAWQSGKFSLRIDRLLEDSCGNSLERQFEIARVERTLNKPTQRYSRIDFQIGTSFSESSHHNSSNWSNWGEWRGPQHSGVSSEGNLPVSWSPSELLVWQAETAGPGASTPIVWEDRIFITAQTGRDAKIRRPGVVLSREDDELELCIQCFRRSDGTLLWQHRLKPNGSLTPTHSLHNQCTPSCVTDGQRVIAWFATGQLHCYDMEGNEQWSRNLASDYGAFDLLWAHASSPALFSDLVYLLCDHDPQANLIALRADSGKEVWKVNRGSGLRSYSTPVVYQRKGEVPQIIVNSNPGIDGYDALTGRQLWDFAEFCKVPVPVPVVVDGTLYAGRGYTNGPLIALPLPLRDKLPRPTIHLTKGDASWRLASRAPYVSSPLIYNGRIYLASENGQVRCLDQSSGEILWSRKLGTTFWSSPVAGDGKIYLLDEAGEMIVLADTSELTVLARNRLFMPEGERMLGSPSISHGCLFFRSESKLFCVGIRSDH
ncbi:MAG: outer membrane protein assembly factor BamB [Verrucomicrobiales bacterium]|jgi:outer membrane protein assembly factor BamB